MLQKKAIILWQKMLGPDWWKVARGWEADWWQGSMAGWHGGMAGKHGKLPLNIGGSTQRQVDWIGVAKISRTRLWRQAAARAPNSRRVHLSLSDTTQAKLVVVGPWRPAACLPSVMSTFGEILAHLGTVIMGVQGVRHIGHIGYSWVQPVGQTAISPNMNSGHSTSDMRASRQSTVNRCQLGTPGKHKSPTSLIHHTSQIDQIP